MLVPTLRLGDIVVVMGNLAVHKGIAIRAMVKAAGAILQYLPLYPPDFGPIKNAFANLEAVLHKAAARTIDDLWDAIRYPLLTIAHKSAKTISPPQNISQSDQALPLESDSELMWNEPIA